MKPTTREIYFFGSVFIFSVILLSFRYFYVPGSNSVNPIKFQLVVPSDIKFGEIPNSTSDQFIFSGGYAYKNTEHFSGSEFFSQSIVRIPTSVYWRSPVSVPKSLLTGEATENGVRWNLYLAKKNDLPVISIICDPDDFFSYENGIYVQGEIADFTASKKFYPMPWHKPANYYKRENDKRRVHLTYYDTSGKVTFNSMVHAEISGHATRCFSQKSLRISADKTLVPKS